jgi:glycosyltransferase involved in cell wall biosynthesis
MLSEIACVTTDVGDAALVVGETGIIVPARDPNALASGLVKLASETAINRRARGRQARERAIENFSISATAEKFHKLYKETHTN